MKQYFDMTTLEELIMYSTDENTGELDKAKLLQNINCNIEPIVNDAVIKVENEIKADMQHEFEQYARSLY